MAGLMRQINVLARCESSYRAKSSSANLPGVYHSYVLAICKNPGWSQERLAKHLCINKSNVTRHLLYLEENGYIERRVCEEDKRELLVFPTRKMLDIQPEVTEITHRWNAELTDGMDAEEVARLAETLEKLSERARELLYGKGGAE